MSTHETDDSINYDTPPPSEKQFTDMGNLTVATLYHVYKCEFCSEEIISVKDPTKHKCKSS